MEQLSFYKKCMYVTTILAETMAAPERARDNFDWSGFIMGNLQWQLTTIHTKKFEGVWGIELMDAILRKWYLHDERIIELGSHIHIDN